MLDSGENFRPENQALTDCLSTVIIDRHNNLLPNN